VGEPFRTQAVDGRQPATSEQAAALGSAVRLRIIRLTFQEALTNKEIAQGLGRDPATTLHHVRKLVATGFLEALPARRGARGAKEIPYRSTGLSWKLNVADGLAVQQAMLEAFLGEVADVGADQLAQTRVVLQLDARSGVEFDQRLRALLDEFAARSAQPGAARRAVYVASYPSA